MRFIGDVHAEFNAYADLIAPVPASIQVGDFGIGFGEPPTTKMQLADHWFLRGNHDAPALCKRHPRWIMDGTMHRGVFCIGGAYSIDVGQRIEGKTWWPDEELSYSDLTTVRDTYVELKPDVVATHDIPEMLAQQIFKGMIPVTSRTRQALDIMFEAHQPKLWIFGHWHTPVHVIAEGCEFICLPPLAVVDIDL